MFGYIFQELSWVSGLDCDLNYLQYPVSSTYPSLIILAIQLLKIPVVVAISIIHPVEGFFIDVKALDFFSIVNPQEQIMQARENNGVAVCEEYMDDIAL